MFPKGGVLVEPGLVPKAAYFILDGRVQILLTSPTRAELLLATRGPGDLVGETAILGDRRSPVTARAVQPTETLAIPPAAFHAALEKHPDLYVDLARALSAQLGDSYEFIQDSTFLDVAGRLAKKLLRLAADHGVCTDDGILISHPVTQLDLARMLGVTRETVNKHVASFRARGILDVRCQRIVVRQPEALRQRIY